MSNRARLFDHVDIWLAAIVALAGVAAVVLNLDPLIRTAFAVPLVLFLPGFAIVTFLFPSPIIPTVERLLISGGASIAIAIVSGLALAAAGIPLSKESWSVTLAAISVAGLAGAWLRRVWRGVAGPRANIVTMPRLSVLMVVIAALAALNALAGSRLVANDQASPAPEALWMVPVDGQPDEAQVGMRAGGQGGDYVIRLTSNDNLLHEFSVELAPEQEWASTVIFPAGARADPIVAGLYEDGGATETRYVVLQPATNGS